MVTSFQGLQHSYESNTGCIYRKMVRTHYRESKRLKSVHGKMISIDLPKQRSVRRKAKLDSARDLCVIACCWIKACVADKIMSEITTDDSL